jgi:hypothetical protein
VTGRGVAGRGRAWWIAGRGSCGGVVVAGEAAVVHVEALPSWSGASEIALDADPPVSPPSAVAAARPGGSLF